MTKMHIAKSGSSGDIEFGEEILLIGKSLHWDVEQDISGVMGDILAHRVVQAGEGLKHWQTATARNLWQTLVGIFDRRAAIACKIHGYA